VNGRKIVITGATGQVGLPVATSLAADNEVWAAARFSDDKARARLEEAGVHCAVADLGSGDFSAVPTDPDYVLHFAVSRTDSFDKDITDNAEATGLLMTHCRAAKAFLHCSSTAVYQEKGHDAISETDPLGDNHRVMFATYSIVKIATEAVVRTYARTLGLPTVIARLNVPYGDNGGWPLWHLLMMKGGVEIPVHTDAPTIYNPIHDDDILAFVPKLLDLAAVPVPIVNLGGDDTVSVEDWCAYIGDLTGFEPTFRPTDKTLESVSTDNTKRQELLGPTSVHWKDGLRRMIQARHPELLKK
jgi:nucleoside-diphosphate-sugar epimerase